MSSATILHADMEEGEEGTHSRNSTQDQADVVDVSGGDAGGRARAPSQSDTPLATVRPRSAFGVVGVACLAALQFGYSTAVMSGALAPVLASFWPCPSSSSSSSSSSFSSSMDPNASSISISVSASSESCETASSVMQGLLVSVILAGALAGALGGGPLADAVGRLAALAVDEALYAAGALLCALARGPALFIVGRVVLGLGVGVGSTVPSMYAAEVAPLHQRGQVGVFNQLMVCTGIFVAYTVCALLGLLRDTDLAWRLMVGAPVAVAALHALLLLAVPACRVESPRWLALRRRHAHARAALQRLRGHTYSEAEYQDLLAAVGEAASSSASSSTEDLPDAPQKEQEQEQEQQEQQEQTQQHSALYEVCHPARPIVIATGLMFWQQITGINAVLYYLSTFFMTAGMSAELAGYMSMVVGAVNIAMTFVSVPLIERVGRKPLLLVSLGGMTATLAAIGFIGLFAGTGSAAGISSVVVTALFVVSFAVGMGCCPWAVINELFSHRARGIAVSLAMATNWVTNLFVTLVFPVIIEAVNMGYAFIGFAVLGVCAFVFVAALLPETKGRTVEDIVSQFRKH